jgi:hypothetical protein
MPPPLKIGYKRGPQFRQGQLVHIFDYLPPMMMQSLNEWGKPSSPWLPICGRCFRGLGDDPFAGHPGQLRPLTIENNQRCFRCGKRCHPVG